MDGAEKDPYTLESDQFCAAHRVIEKWAPDIPPKDRDAFLVELCRTLRESRRDDGSGGT